MKLYSNIAAVIAFISAAFYADAQISFEVKKISPRVYVAHPSQVSRVNATSVILVGDTFLTVVESQPDTRQAELLLKEIRKSVSSLPIRYLVLTHFHLDHILGISSFVKENKDLIIVSHSNAKDHIQNFGEQEKQQWLSIIQNVYWHRLDQTAGDFKNIDNSGDKTREEWLAIIREFYKRQSEAVIEADEIQKYYEDILKSPVSLPTLTFTDSLIIFDGNFSYKLSYMGWGHTNSDIIIHVPQEKLLIVGDLLHDFEPLFTDAKPDEWIDILEKLRKLDFTFIVGGHGEAQIGKTILEQWRNYVKEIVAKVKISINSGESLEAFLHRTDVKSFKSLQLNDYGDRIQSFRTGYVSVLTGSLEDAVKENLRNLWEYYRQHSTK